MKIGIIADTHDNLPAIRKAIDIFNDKKIDLLFHAGDFVSPFTINEIKRISCPFAGVFGNNDGDRLFLKNQFQQIGPIFPEPYKTNVTGKKIIMFHKNDIIAELAKSQEFDIIIYGHTHKKDLHREGNTIVINPGECGGWVTGASSIAILSLNTLAADIIELK